MHLILCDTVGLTLIGILHLSLRNRLRDTRLILHTLYLGLRNRLRLALLSAIHLTLDTVRLVLRDRLHLVLWNELHWTNLLWLRSKRHQGSWSLHRLALILRRHRRLIWGIPIWQNMRCCRLARADEVGMLRDVLGHILIRE